MGNIHRPFGATLHNLIQDPGSDAQQLIVEIDVLALPGNWNM